MIEPPIKVVDQYNHKSPTDREIKAGVKDLAGFIEALDINDKNEISSATIPPIACLLFFLWKRDKRY
jgi:hypothetical protein